MRLGASIGLRRLGMSAREMGDRREGFGGRGKDEVNPKSELKG